MAIVLYLKQFLHDLQAQKLRTLLTLIGLTWGTVTVICLLAFGYGLQKQQEESFRDWAMISSSCGHPEPANHSPAIPKDAGSVFNRRMSTCSRENISETGICFGRVSARQHLRSLRSQFETDRCLRCQRRIWRACAPWFPNRGDGF